MGTDWRELKPDDEAAVAGSDELRPLLDKAIKKRQQKQFEAHDPKLTESVARSDVVAPTNETEPAQTESQQSDRRTSRQHIRSVFTESCAEVQQSAAAGKDAGVLQIRTDRPAVWVRERLGRILHEDSRRQMKQAIIRSWERDAFVPQLAVLFFCIAGCYLFNWSKQISDKNQQLEAEIKSTSRPISTSAAPSPRAPAYADANVSAQGVREVPGQSPLERDVDLASRMSDHLKQHPHDRAVRRQLIALLIKLDRCHEAQEQLELLKQAGELTFDDEMMLAFCYLAQGRADLAKNTYGSMLTYYSNWNQRVQIYDGYIQANNYEHDDQDAAAIVRKATFECKTEGERKHFLQLLRRSEPSNAMLHWNKRVPVAANSTGKLGG